MSYLIDLHIHSKLYSSCAQTLDPFQLAGVLVEKGLHGAVLAEHDSRWASAQFELLQEHDRRCQLFNGMELTTAGNYHFVLLGLEDDSLISKGMDAEDAIDKVHQQGGAAILAHPFRTGVPPLQVLEKIDAVELGSTSFSEKESQLCALVAEELGKPLVGSSDAHALERVGWGYTEFPVRPEDEKHLCAMIRSGMGVAVLPNPFIRR